MTRPIRLLALLACFGVAGATLAADALPSFEQQEYPGAKKIGEMTMGETSSRQYETSDDLAKVIEFYKPKFPKQQIISEDGAVFMDPRDDGSAFTVTVGKSEGKTTIVIMRQQKPAE